MVGSHCAGFSLIRNQSVLLSSLLEWVILDFLGFYAHLRSSRLVSELPVGKVEVALHGC